MKTLLLLKINKEMKFIYTIVFAVVFGFCLNAQESGTVVNTIKGKVINTETNDAVSYTNIGIEGTLFGTASNEEGIFELKITEEMAGKNIYFSAVGYKNKIMPVNSLFDKEFNIIKIESQSYGIKDVDIAAQNMVLIRILRMAAENTPYNFIQGPFNLLGTYSNTKTVDTVTTIQSAEVLIYDASGYANPSKQNAFQSLKYSFTTDKSDADYRFSSGGTNLDELLETDWVRTASSILNPKLASIYSLKLLDQPKINGADFWVISFEEKKPTLAGSGDYYANKFEGKITIKKEDYSVLKIEGKIESPKNNRQGKALAIGNSNTNYFENVSTNFSILYETLKPAKIEIDKKYTFKGLQIAESSVLQITKVKATDLTELDSRQYFSGK